MLSRFAKGLKLHLRQSERDKFQQFLTFQIRFHFLFFCVFNKLQSNRVQAIEIWPLKNEANSMQSVIEIKIKI